MCNDWAKSLAFFSASKLLISTCHYTFDNQNELLKTNPSSSQNSKWEGGTLMHIHSKQHSLTSPHELFKILHACKDIVGEIRAFSVVSRNDF